MSSSSSTLPQSRYSHLRCTQWQLEQEGFALTRLLCRVLHYRRLQASRLQLWSPQDITRSHSMVSLDAGTHLIHLCCASVRIDLPVPSSAGSISAAHDPSPGRHASSALHSYGHCVPCPEETVVISYLLTQSPPQGSHAPAQSTSGSANTVGAAIALATTPPTEMVIPLDVSATVATLHEKHSNSGSGQRSGNSRSRHRRS